MSASQDCRAAPGSIIAAIIGTLRATKEANEPSRVATPMSIPFICSVEYMVPTMRHVDPQ
jgi:hypothetical protein